MIAGLILAAGRSARMGRPKQLLPIGDRPLLQHVVDVACSADLADVVVVLGHAAEEVAAGLSLPPQARVVMNPEHGAGQSTSLSRGLESLGREVEAAVILLGDQPAVRRDAVRAVVEAYRQTGGPIVQASYRGVSGHPVLFHRRVWSTLHAVQGDMGARAVLRDHPDWVVPVEIDEPPPADVDSWKDYRRITQTWRESPPTLEAEKLRRPPVGSGPRPRAARPPF
jgi:molybdenum cofactor cytidylyltransferase